MTRLYGLAFRGHRVVAKVPHGYWKTTTFVGALRVGGMPAPLVVDGAMNGRVFRAYVEQQLVQVLHEGDTVILDNLSAHKVACVREAIEATGARRIYLLSYSPNLNPIELFFSKLKSLLRSAAEKTVQGLDKTIGEILGKFTATECQHYFQHFGYRAQHPEKRSRDAQGTAAVRRAGVHPHRHAACKLFACCFQPNGRWMQRQAEVFLDHGRMTGLHADHVTRDRNVVFATKNFDTVLRNAGVRVIPTAARVSSLQSSSLRAIDHFRQQLNSSIIAAISMTGSVFLALYYLHVVRRGRSSSDWFSFRSLFRATAKAGKLVTAAFKTYDDGRQHWRTAQGPAAEL